MAAAGEIAGREPTRREVLHALGMLGGASVLYQAMEAMGHAKESQFAGPPNLSGARPGASVTFALSGGRTASAVVPSGLAPGAVVTLSVPKPSLVPAASVTTPKGTSGYVVPGVADQRARYFAIIFGNAQP